MKTNDVIDAFVAFLSTRPDIRDAGMPIFIGTCSPDVSEVGVLLGGADLMTSVHDALLVRMAAHLCRQRATEFGIGIEVTHNSNVFGNNEQEKQSGEAKDQSANRVAWPFPTGNDN